MIEQNNSISQTCAEISYKLTNEQLSEFYQNGYIILRKLFLPEQIEELSSLSDNAKEKALDLATNGGGIDSPLHDHTSKGMIYAGTQFVVKYNEEVPAIQRVVWAGSYAPKLLEYGRSLQITIPVAQILESDRADHIINQLHYKLPHDNVTFLWHQDVQNRKAFCSNWKDINGKGSYVVVFTAIDENNENNGPLFVVPGSNHLDLDFKRMSETSELPSEIDVSLAVPLLLDPGDTAFMHPNLVHASFANDSEQSRRVLINGFSYPGANTCQYPGEGSGEQILLTGIGSDFSC